MKKPETRNNKELTFEQAIARLEEIVDDLESGDQGLEEAIALFEEGSKLSKFCEENLASAQGKIEKLINSTGTTEELIDKSPQEETKGL